MAVRSAARGPSSLSEKYHRQRGAAVLYATTGRTITGRIKTAVRTAFVLNNVREGKDFQRGVAVAKKATPERLFGFVVKPPSAHNRQMLVRDPSSGDTQLVALGQVVLYSPK